MKHTEQWIWLPTKTYKDFQTTVYSGFNSYTSQNYAVAEFCRDYKFTKKVVAADLRFSGDSAFQLSCNERIIATGPPCVGGDFIGNDSPRENFYAYNTKIHPNSDTLSFFARVRLLPVQICDYSKGHGGFMLSAILTFEDGSHEEIFTDSGWLATKNSAYINPLSYDGRLLANDFVSAEVVPNIWNALDAPIPVRYEREILCDNSSVHLSPGEEKSVFLDFDKIWGGFLRVVTENTGEIKVDVEFCELAEEPEHSEHLIFTQDTDYRGFYLHSAGNLRALIKNNSKNDAEVTVSFISTHYPVYDEAVTVTNDTDVNNVLETCKHTLKICRQTHHLDSTKHCEPLACFGDYYIESLMTPFSFGDMRLAEFDLIRGAVMLERENGRLFHTTYSLIWVKMLYDVYMISGNIELLQKCEKGLSLLLSLFEKYMGKNGLIENPPDYMFIDWIYIDGFSMHHPPKALGQTCLNMFYFGALDSATNIYKELNNIPQAEKLIAQQAKLKSAINSILFDKEKRVYFEGTNTPTDSNLLGDYMPENTQKRYYLKHSNILAAYFGVCDDDTAVSLIGKIINNDINGDYQPYFAHYLLEAVNRLNLRDKYTLKLIRRWVSPVKECSKGLVEGFVKPEPDYSFDHSHAWGGTPLYSLPKALLGLKINKPGMSDLTLSPSLLGLEQATVELLTPLGKIICNIEEGKQIKITHPKEIKINIEE